MKKIVAIILSLAMLLSLTACNESRKADTPAPPTETTAPIETEPPFDIASYKNTITTCTNQIYDNAVVLFNVAKYENNYWESLDQMNSKVTTEKLVSAAWKWLEKNSDHTEATVTSQHNSIMSFYKDIVATEINGAEAESLKEIFDECFDAYLSLYNLATSPSGDRSSFIDSCNSSTSTINTCQSKLEVLLS